MTIQEAAAKWNRNTQGKADKWYRNTSAAGANAYCQGLAKLGIPVQACLNGPGAHFVQGVQAAGPASFQQGVSGKEGKWAQDFAAAFSG